MKFIRELTEDEKEFIAEELTWENSSWIERTWQLLIRFKVTIIFAAIFKIIFILFLALFILRCMIDFPFFGYFIIGLILLELLRIPATRKAGGLLLVILGSILCLTIIGILWGIPMIILGGFLLFI